MDHHSYIRSSGSYTHRTKPKPFSYFLFHILAKSPYFSLLCLSIACSDSQSLHSGACSFRPCSCLLVYVFYFFGYVWLIAYLNLIPFSFSLIYMSYQSVKFVNWQTWEKWFPFFSLGIWSLWAFCISWVLYGIGWWWFSFFMRMNG